MEIRDQHGIVMAEIGPGPVCHRLLSIIGLTAEVFLVQKDNPRLNPEDARNIYFDGTFEDPKGVYKKPYSVEE